MGTLDPPCYQTIETFASLRESEVGRTFWKFQKEISGGNSSISSKTKGHQGQVA
jgi:hypothetical protein